jgi:hypothetical protein
MSIPIILIYDGGRTWEDSPTPDLDPDHPDYIEAGWKYHPDTEIPCTSAMDVINAIREHGEPERYSPDGGPSLAWDIRQQEAEAARKWPV